MRGAPSDPRLPGTIRRRGRARRRIMARAQPARRVQEAPRQRPEIPAPTASFACGRVCKLIARKIARPQTKSIESSPSAPLRRSKWVGPHGHHPFEPARSSQPTIGNQAMLRLLARREPAPTAKPAAGPLQRAAGLEFAATQEEARGFAGRRSQARPGAVNGLSTLRPAGTDDLTQTDLTVPRAGGDAGTPTPTDFRGAERRRDARRRSAGVVLRSGLLEGTGRKRLRRRHLLQERQEYLCLAEQHVGGVDEREGPFDFDRLRARPRGYAPRRHRLHRSRRGAAEFQGRKERPSRGVHRLQGRGRLLRRPRGRLRRGRRLQDPDARSTNNEARPSECQLRLT